MLVTGASSGIGEITSTMLALRGCRVAGAGRSFARSAVPFVLETFVEGDLTEPGAPEEVVRSAAAALGGLDVVVSNAGAGWSGAFGSMAQSELDWVFDLNLRAPLHLARAAAGHLVRSGGQLVLVGSVAGKVGVAEEVAYSAAKAGLSGFADGLRSEWSPLGVAVTLVSPGVVDTPFFSRRNRPYMRTWPKPVPAAVVGHAVVRAISSRTAEVYVPYWTALVARFHGAAPGLYRLLAERGSGLGAVAAPDRGRRHERPGETCERPHEHPGEPSNGSAGCNGG